MSSDDAIRMRFPRTGIANATKRLAMFLPTGFLERSANTAQMRSETISRANKTDNEALITHLSIMIMSIF